MKYIDVAWLHKNSEYPIRLVSEMDDELFEVRKLEFFPDGKVGFASQTSSTNSTMLGIEPIPMLSEINQDPQFIGKAISASEFQTLWCAHGPRRT